MPATHSEKIKEPSVIYLYLLTPAPLMASIDSALQGIDEIYPVTSHPLGTLTAITSRVKLNSFIGEAAEQNLKDIQWITPRVGRHANIVAHVMEQSPVLPVRFGTIFSSVKSMTHALAYHEAAIHSFLIESGGKKEYSLKGYMDQNAVLKTISDHAISEASQRLLSMSSGARYFEEKRINQQSRKLLENWLHDARLIIADALEAHQLDLTELKLKSRQVSGHPLQMVIHWALLTSAPETIHEKVFKINEIWEPKGISLEVSGPFPPYSFCPELTFEGGP